MQALKQFLKPCQNQKATYTRDVRDGYRGMPAGMLLQNQASRDGRGRFASRGQRASRGLFGRGLSAPPRVPLRLSTQTHGGGLGYRPLRTAADAPRRLSSSRSSWQRWRPTTRASALLIRLFASSPACMASWKERSARSACFGLALP